MDKLPKWFSVMLVPKLLLTPIKIRIFGRKTAKFGPKYAILVILGQIWHFWPISSNARPKNNANKVPSGLVGGCGARAVSRKTPIYFIVVVVVVVVVVVGLRPPAPPPDW